MSIETSCDHKYIHLRSDAYWQKNGRYSLKYTHVDYFFCERCLDEQTKVKQVFLGDHEVPHKLPEWAKSITKQVQGYE